MPKGYWIGRVDVHNDEGYAPYIAANGAIFKKFNGRPIVRGGRFEAVEGSARSRNVVIEFPTFEQGVACFQSDEYNKAAAFRRSGAGEVETIMVDAGDATPR